jgi:hypothetical protein
MQTYASSTQTTNTPVKRPKIHLLFHYLACIGGLIVAIMNGALSYHYIALAVPQISLQARIIVAFASFLCNAFTFTLGAAQILSQLRVSSLFGVQHDKPFSWSFRDLCVALFTFISNIGFAFCLFTLGQDAWSQIMNSYGITSANSIYATYACSIGFSMSNFATFIFSKKSSDITYSFFVHFISIVQSTILVWTVGLTALPVLYTIMPTLPAQILAALVGTSLWNINRKFYAGNVKQCIDAFYDKGPNGLGQRFSQNKLLSVLLFVLTVLNAAGSAATAPVKRMGNVALRYLLLGNGFFASSLLNLNTMRRFMGDKHSWPETKSESIRLIVSLGLSIAISTALLLPSFVFSPITVSTLLYAALVIILSMFYRMDTPPAASASVIKVLTPTVDDPVKQDVRHALQATNNSVSSGDFKDTTRSQQPQAPAPALAPIDPRISELAVASI